MPPRRLTTIAVLLLVWLAPDRGHAATWCVATASELQQALVTASLSAEADVIRLQAGTYVSGHTTGFAANLAGGALQLSGGWSAGCLFRRRGVRSTIDGQYQRPGMVIGGSLPHGLTVRIANMAFVRGVGPEFGGLAVSGSGGNTLSVEIEDCRFHDNTHSAIEDSIGGGLFVAASNVSVLGSVFTDNHSGVSGGGAALSCFGALGAFTNNTVTRNSAQSGQPASRGGVTLFGNCLWEVANNILWDNDGVDLTIPNGEATLRNNNIDGLNGTPVAGSSGNVSIDPGFVSSGILRLRRNSALVDAGFNETLLGLPQFSYDGGIRIAGPRIDIGAYELDVLLDSGFDPPFSASP